MKILDKFLRSKKTSIRYGIIYNIEDLREIRYWDHHGNQHSLFDLPNGLDEGVYMFGYHNDKILILGKSPT